MQLSSFTTINMTDGHISPTTVYTSRRKLEKVLLFLIAGIGILGSAYLFTASSGSNNSPEFSNISYASVLPTSIDQEDVAKERFNDYVKIEGKKKVGQTLDFSFDAKKREKNVRYVMEMGNEVRMIITVDNFPFVYEKPGKYLLELKKIEKGLISTIATKKIKIKK